MLGTVVFEQETYQSRQEEVVGIVSFRERAAQFLLVHPLPVREEVAKFSWQRVMQAMLGISS